MPRTIWYISKYVAPPHLGAPGSRSWELMRELAAQGHRTVVVCSDANHLAVVPELREAVLVEERDGIDVHWLRTFKATTAKSWQRMVSWLHFEWRLARLDTSEMPRPDAVIVSSLSLFTVLNGLRLKRKLRVPLVFEVRDIWPLTLVEEGGYSATSPLIRVLGLIERLGYRRADRIVGTMPGLGKHVEEVLGSPRDVHCVPMGYASRRLPPAPDRSDRPSRRPGELVVGYAGTIGITNALEVMLDAARELRDDPGIRFRVLGDGPLLSRFKDEYGDLANLEFVDKVPKEQVDAELQKCDVLYLSTYPSRVWEFGQSLNKLIDYMLAGRPVVASYSGLPSMIDEAGCGSFVPAGDPHALALELRRLAGSSSEELDEMGARGRAWLLEHRSYARLAEQYHDLIFADAPDGAGRR